MSLLPHGPSEPCLIGGLHMSPSFGSLLTTPLSRSLGKPEVILV